MDIRDILNGAASPMMHSAPSANSNTVIPEETYPDGFFDDEEEFDEQTEDPNFQDNLAEELDESYLDKLASGFRGDIEDDETDRQPWMDMVSNVQEQIGIGEDSNYEEPFPGASSVVYPLITKAQIQFQARALPEIFPNDPVKALVIGNTNEELDQQAERVSGVMNYQIQYQDPGNKKDFRKMLWWLPLVGSAFRYVSHDPLKNINIVRFVPAGDLIVPYATTSLADAYRITHRFRDSRNDIIKLMRAGFYRDVDLFEGSNTVAYDGGDDSDNAVTQLRDASDGTTPHSDNSTNGQSQVCYNIYTYCDLRGYEDTDDDGNETGIALPYVFTMHEPTGKILAIRRNWKQDDEYKTQRVYFSHYKFQEGAGFYGSGLPHLIGSLQEATTGALRAFGDSMAFSLLQGGFKLKDAKISGNQTMKPGGYLDVDMDTEDINRAIKPLNFPAPTPQAMAYIEMLRREAEGIVSTTDIMTGDSSPQNAPVGSTLAMIEQANKVISAQHKSLYESLSEELQILADLNYDFLPDEDEFAVPGKAGIIRRADFDGKIDVIPTADPSVSSFQQRQAIDQATLQIFSIPEFKPYAKEAGYPLLRRMLKNLNVPNIDEIMISEDEFIQMQQQAQQTPPPPDPNLIKAQVAQADSQTKAQVAASDAQLEQAKLEIDRLRLELEDKAIDMKFATDDKMINARYMGTVMPALQQSSDALAMQNIMHEQQKEIQQNDQRHQQMMQQAAAQQAMQQQAVEPTAEPVQEPEPVESEKQGMLKRLMNKIRGK